MTDPVYQRRIEINGHTHEKGQRVDTHMAHTLGLHTYALHYGHKHTLTLQEVNLGTLTHSFYP